MRKAFTLAETLVTLGIIGVVAALTMPTLIQKHQKQTTVTKLKHTYSLLFQALKASEIENGEISNWDFGAVGCAGASEFTEKYIAPYLKIVKKCICDNTGECNITGTSLNNPTSTFDVDYYTTRSEKLFLSNGSIISVSRAPSTDYPIFIADINGRQKPNVIGKDIFEFEYFNGKFAARGAEFDKNDLKTEANGCHKEGTGAFCAQMIMLDNWQISEDYPW